MVIGAMFRFVSSHHLSACSSLSMDDGGFVMEAFMHAILKSDGTKSTRQVFPRRRSHLEVSLLIRDAGCTEVSGGVGKIFRFVTSHPRCVHAGCRPVRLFPRFRAD